MSTDDISIEARIKNVASKIDYQNGVWDCTKEEATELLGRVPCCRYDMGGSHYHCGKCGGESGMQGHYGRKYVDGVPSDWGFHCPDEPRISEWDDNDN